MLNASTTVNLEMEYANGVRRNRSEVRYVSRSDVFIVATLVVSAERSPAWCLGVVPSACVASGDKKEKKREEENKKGRREEREPPEI